MLEENVIERLEELMKNIDFNYICMINYSISPQPIPLIEMGMIKKNIESLERDIEEFEFETMDGDLYTITRKPYGARL